MSEERQQKEIFKDKATQEMLNKPLEASGSFSAEDERFLDMLMRLIEEGKIELYKPASLLNEEVYNVTTDELRGKADFEALQMLATIREIKDLCDNDMRETKQVENLVYRLRVSKERFEAKEGDLFYYLDLMAEENSAKIVADKNKTPDQYIQEAEEFYIVPDLIRDEFPDLIKLIFETESMDQEEREYWLQIMPIMDKEQIEKFRGILVNEQEQLQEIEQSGTAGGIDVPKAPVITEEEMKRKMREIAEKKKAHEEQEVAQEEELLKSLEGL